MGIKLSYIRSLLLPLTLLVAGGCRQDDLPAPADDSGEQPYLVVRIALPATDGYTRSNPAGGEEGNGREDAVLNEDVIHDINVFFYRDDNGLDGAADKEILYSIYYNLDDRTDSRNTKLKVLEWDDASLYGSKFLELSVSATGKEVDEIKIDNGDKFAAVANVGYIADNIKTLGDLRDMKFGTTNAWTSTGASADAADMDRFIMSTGFNTEYFYNNRSTGKNTIEYKNEVYSGVTTLERLAARIDLWYNAGENAGISADEASDSKKFEKLVYDVIDTKGNQVYIRNVLPVNVMQTPSYLFKKVTASTQPESYTLAALKTITEFKWAGKETPVDISTGGTDRPTNYVIDPHTLLKDPAGSAADNALWFGETALDKVKTAIAAGSAGKLSDYFDMQRVRGAGDPDYGCDRISVISYANENTNPTDCFHSTYLTGLAFKGLYIPSKVYKAYGEGGSLEEMQDADWAAMGDDVKIYRYSPSSERVVKESESLYFIDRGALDAYAKSNPADNPVIEAFDYAEDDGKYGLVCYYNLWIRHYNDVDDANASDPHDKLPMEYAIVRNNIYRVALEFTGPGDPEPTMREPDTMKARIFVRKWNLREEENALEF